MLRPAEAVLRALVSELASVEDLSRYVFAEQDFLNEHVRGRWVALPYLHHALGRLWWDVATDLVPQPVPAAV